MPANKIYLIIIVMVLGMAAFLAMSGLKLPALEPMSSVSPSVSPTDLIVVSEPTPNSLVKSPVTFSGQARGYWFFEASFPIKVYDANGVELGVAVAQADGEWMTEDFVGFSAALEFKKPITENGTVVFYKDNPSGLPENDAELRVPVLFDLANWPNEIPSEQPSISRAPSSSQVGPGCKISGCSNQLCLDSSSEDTITTCEYKEEYVCYQAARCEKQEDGNCGWTPTEELVACLYSAWQDSEPPQ